MDLEAVWALREDEVYPALFGPVGRGIFTLSPELFAQRFGLSEVDPRWLHIGVFEFPPTTERPHWLYVTSGYSNPWDQDPAGYDPEGDSGTGVEFCFAVSEQGDWAIQALQTMLALALLLDAGHYPDSDGFSMHAPVPLGGPIDGRPDGAIRNLILVEREDGPQEFTLPSGHVMLVGFTGVTDAELAFAQANGVAPLLDKLRLAGCHPVTDVGRGSIV